MEQNLEVKKLNEWTTLVKIVGHFDAEMALQVGPVVKELTEGLKLLIFDMEKINFLASGGLGVLLAASQDMEEHQGQVWLVNIQPQAKKIFQLTRVESVFRFFDSMEELEQNLPEKEK